MIGGTPVAQAADVHTGLIRFGDIGHSGLDGRSFVGNEFYQLGSLVLPGKDLAQQSHGTGKLGIKHAVGTGTQGDHRHAKLLLEGIGFFHIFKLGDHNIGVAGQDLFRLGGLGHGATHTAGGQLGEGLAEGQHIGPGHGIKHHGAFGQCGVVDIFHTGQKGHIPDVAIHSQRAGTDADNSFVAAGLDHDRAANHIGDGHFLPAAGRILGHAGAQGNQQRKNKQQGKQFLSIHSGNLPE